MDKLTFHNCIRILMNIDKWELVEAGIIKDDSTSGTCWTRFNNDPLIFIAKLNDDAYDALWDIMKKREKRLV